MEKGEEAKRRGLSARIAKYSTMARYVYLQVNRRVSYLFEMRREFIYVCMEGRI